MACVNNLFYVVAVLASAHVILAEEGSGQPDSGSPSHQNTQGSEHGKHNPFGNIMDGFSSFGNFGGSSGNPFSGFASAFGFPTNLSSLFSGFGSRHGAVPHSGLEIEDFSDDEEESESQSEEGTESRLFFSSLFNTRLTTCNYTTQPGASCASCRQVRQCRPNNVATVRRCGLFFPYCTNGRCSLTPTAACNPATTAATTAATAVATAATTVAPTTV